MSRKKTKFYLSPKRKNNEKAWAYFEYQNYNLLERSLTAAAKEMLGAREFRLVRILVDDPQTWYLDVHMNDGAWRTINLNDPNCDAIAKSLFIEPPEWDGLTDDQLLDQIAPVKLGEGDDELRKRIAAVTEGLNLDKIKEAFGLDGGVKVQELK